MRRRVKNKPTGFKKIVARLSLAEWHRAESIRDKYGFKSIYEMNQYLWGCFLRVADPDRDEQEEPVPDEIRAMFDDLSHAERCFEYVKPKRKLPQKTIDDMEGQLRIWQ